MKIIKDEWRDKGKTRCAACTGMARVRNRVLIIKCDCGKRRTVCIDHECICDHCGHVENS